MIFSQSLQQERSPADTLILAHRIHIQTSDPPDYKIINLCCFVYYIVVICYSSNRKLIHLATYFKINICLPSISSLPNEVVGSCLESMLFQKNRKRHIKQLRHAYTVRNTQEMSQQRKEILIMSRGAHSLGQMIKSPVLFRISLFFLLLTIKNSIPDTIHKIKFLMGNNITLVI